jgi:hypothetical protein
VHRDKFLTIKPTRCTNFSNLFLEWNSTCFGQFFHHQEFFTVHIAMVYISKPVWHIPLLCVQWRTPDDGQRNCPKHVEFHSKNKFEKLVHLVGFIIRNLSRCTVAWTSNLFFVCSATRIFCVQCGRTFRKAIFFITASNANAQSSFNKMNLQGKKISGCRNVPEHGRVSRDRSKPTSDRSTVVMGRCWSTSLYDAVQLLPAVLMRD